LVGEPFRGEYAQVDEGRLTCGACRNQGAQVSELQQQAGAITDLAIEISGLAETLYRAVNNFQGSSDGEMNLRFSYDALGRLCGQITLMMEDDPLSQAAKERRELGSPSKPGPLLVCAGQAPEPLPQAERRL
jgi:YD repeat-containing protein